MSTSSINSPIGRRSTVCKSYEVIMARGKDQLGLHDMLTFLYLLHRSYGERETSSGIQRVSVGEVLDYLGHTSVSYLEKSMRALRNVKIDIDYQEDGREHSVSYHFLSWDLCRT